MGRFLIRICHIYFGAEVIDDFFTLSYEVVKVSNLLEVLSPQVVSDRLKDHY